MIKTLKPVNKRQKDCAMFKNLTRRYKNSPPFDKALFIVFLSLTFVIIVSFLLSALGIWHEAMYAGIVLLPVLVVVMGIIYYKLITSFLS